MFLERIHGIAVDDIILSPRDCLSILGITLDLIPVLLCLVTVSRTSSLLTRLIPRPSHTSGLGDLPTSSSNHSVFLTSVEDITLDVVH